MKIKTSDIDEALHILERWKLLLPEGAQILVTVDGGDIMIEVP